MRMKKIFIAGLCMLAAPAYAMNATADMLRRCEGVNITSSDNYVLRCSADERITKAMADGIEQFFVADNDGDVRGSCLDTVPDNDDYIYVHVVKNSPDTRYADQTCYRFVREKDVQRDGYYAVQICEYERADYYL